MKIPAALLACAGAVLLSGYDRSGSNAAHRAFRFPVVADTFHHELQERWAKEVSTASYHPLYLGPWSDTIHADHGLDMWRRRDDPDDPAGVCFVHDRAGEPGSPYKRPSRNDLTLIVDTTRIIANQAAESLSRRSDLGAFKAYPVLMINSGRDTVYVGYGDFLRVIMEARDAEGEWRPIETRYVYRCGTGVMSIVLPPAFVALTSAPIYHGSFTTECRLRSGKTVSNVFRACIDPGQFEGGPRRFSED
jgi:hypothetical protein